MRFIVEAKGAILCFIIYLIPGLPKDMVCYLLGISPSRSGSSPWFPRLAVSQAPGSCRFKVPRRQPATISRLFPSRHRGGGGLAALLLSDPDPRLVSRPYEDGRTELRDRSD